MIRCGSKNEHQKEMYLKEVGIHVQKTLTIQGSTINIFGKDGGGYMTIK